MIAPLTPDYPLEYLRPEARMAAFPGIIAKLNEVIEVVNDLTSTHCPCVAAGKNLETCPVHGGTVKSPGFRPLHIEDGQVQESAAFGYDQNLDEATDYTAAILKSLSVPEAEPQEQEIPDWLIRAQVDTPGVQPARVLESLRCLREILKEPWETAKTLEWLVMNEERLLVERDGLRAQLVAAHREYAQPETFDPHHPQIPVQAGQGTRAPIGNCPYCDADRGIRTGNWAMDSDGWQQMREQHDRDHV